MPENKAEQNPEIKLRPSEKLLVTNLEAAELCSCCVNTIYKVAENFGIKPVKFGKAVRWRVADLKRIGEQE